MLKPREFINWIVSEFKAIDLRGGWIRIPLDKDHSMLLFRQSIRREPHWMANVNVYNLNGNRVLNKITDREAFLIAHENENGKEVLKKLVEVYKEKAKHF